MNIRATNFLAVMTVCLLAPAAMAVDSVDHLQSPANSDEIEDVCDAAFGQVDQEKLAAEASKGETCLNNTLKTSQEKQLKDGFMMHCRIALTMLANKGEAVASSVFQKAYDEPYGFMFQTYCMDNELSKFYQSQAASYRGTI